jgi:hypothetical protein
MWPKIYLTKCFFFEKWLFDRMFFFRKMVIWLKSGGDKKLGTCTILMEYEQSVKWQFFENDNLKNKNIRSNDLFEKSLRSNELSVKWPFGQITFRSNDLSVKWPFGQMTFRSNDLSVKWTFFQMTFGLNDLSVKWPFGQIIIFRNSFWSSELSVKWIFGQMIFIVESKFGQMTIFWKKSIIWPFGKMTFGQMAFGQTVFGQMVFRSNGLSVKNFRWNDFSVKWSRTEFYWVFNLTFPSCFTHSAQGF